MSCLNVLFEETERLGHQLLVGSLKLVLNRILLG